MAQVWIATAPINHGQFRAFNPGDVVPDSVEAAWDYSTQGLVRRVDNADEDSFIDLTGLGFAQRADVVLRSQLHIGPTPPQSPAVGSVWIDTTA